MENFILVLVVIALALHLKYEESIAPYFSITSVITLICYIMYTNDITNILALTLCIILNGLALCYDFKNMIISIKNYVAN
ncbi:hypothetical protein IIQ_05849 [Bacillus cereus VD118]|uniref:Uncharacterized protein n=1 Tax=Bacillus cereus VD118 TaxID=1053231 RepID=R8QP03_BACCE|nr:hypothetical protein IIQ_05849 [Bacillus cereus VD118]CAH2464618.1 hypothetical protein ACOSJ1_EBGNOMHC_05153 [Bacillus mycoides KBAB4]